jgi:methylene-tetrahydromethanopterin dehydrogenase
MLDRAKASMFKPFVVSLMADPSGAYTTAAAMLACVQAALRRDRPDGLAQKTVLVLGGTGPVGRIAGVIAARCGATVLLSSRGGMAAAQAAALQTGERFQVELGAASAADPAALRASLARADVVLACAAAGAQVVSAQDLEHARLLRVAADLNAVPPEGIAGLGAMDDAKPLPGTQALGIGALAVGNIKYQTQQRLLLQMREAQQPVTLGFAEAYAMAQTVLAQSAGKGASA